MLRPIITLFFINIIFTFSKYYKKCRLGNKNRDIGNITYQKVIKSKHVKNSPLLVKQKALQYQNISFINYNFIDAGASGQVFLIQITTNDQFKILKRYFKQGRFQEENYVMQKMNYQISWTRDPIYNNTMAIFPSTNSKTLYDVSLTVQQTKIVMYKVILQLKKAHDMGFFHMDIKPLNILVDSIQTNQGNFQTVKSHISIIDWNLVNFYYQGAQYLFKRGTACYQAPQLLIWSKYYTPAVDVWSLGVTFFYLLTGKKPYKKCSKQGLKPIVKFLGYKNFMNFYNEIKVQINYSQIKRLQKLKNEQGQMSILFKNMKQRQILNDDEIDMFQRMLQINPQKRISLKQLLQHKNFKRIRQLPQPYQEKNKLKGGKQLNKSNYTAVYQ